MTRLLLSLQKRLPKPLLFGLYGAVGSLLAALMLGEGLWAALAPSTRQPVKPPPPQPELLIAVPPKITVNQNDRNQMMVRIARSHFEGPVRISCPDLPSGVRIDPVEIPADSSSADVDVIADEEAAVGDHAITLLGTSNEAPEATAKFELKVVFVQQPPRLDVMFALDTTGSMTFAIKGVSEGILDFAKAMEEKKINARVGLIAYGDRMLRVPEEPTILKFGDQPFTSNFTQFSEAVKTVKRYGGGDIPESSLDAVVLASRQPFRPKAAKVVLLITDAPPKLPDREMQSVQQAADELKKSGIDQLHLMSRPTDRTRYDLLQKAVPGEFFSLLEAAQERGDFKSILPRVTEAVVERAKLPTAPPPPEKQQPPAPPAAPVVKGVQSTQEFAEEDSGRLLILVGIWTALLAIGVSLALVAGQAFYLRQAGPSAGEAGRSVGGGVLAGLVGGLAGQFLFSMTAGGSGWDALFRVIGWALLGGLVGLGMAFFVPNLRKDRGFLGGALGGILGALGFLGVSLLLRGSGGDIVGRLIGALIVGFFIGLMVAWVERLFRKAWLEITFGPRDRATVNLGEAPVILGSDRKQCTIFAFGSAPVAFRFRMAGGRVICEDVERGTRTNVGPGHTQQIGRVQIKVHTAEGEQEALAPRSEPPPPAPTSPPPDRTRASDHCPGCGRQVPGAPGRRFCMVCERTF